MLRIINFRIPVQDAERLEELLIKKYSTETKKAINKKFAFCDRTFVSLIVILINLRF